MKGRHSAAEGSNAAIAHVGVDSAGEHSRLRPFIAGEKLSCLQHKPQTQERVRFIFQRPLGGPLAGAGNGGLLFGILARLPSVTVAPSGAVRLLGAENVVIQVDGQVVSSASLDAVLRSLSGSDIEKIEVITNPSAQFAANAGGGVINIITRQRFRLGLSGAVSASVDSLGAYQLNASPTWTRGAWSYGLRAGGRRGG